MFVIAKTNPREKKTKTKKQNGEIQPRANVTAISRRRATKGGAKSYKSYIQILANARKS